MVIDNFFIHYTKPRQYLYGGENYVDVYKAMESGKTFKKAKTIENISLLDMTFEQFRDIGRELLDVDTGILLNSGQFIFNIFEFEKIPLQENLRKDLVEWRLKKVFPENLEEYVHDFFKISKNKIISVLFKKSFKEKIEGMFVENGIELTCMGNSTVEIMNYAARKKKETPDFFVEIDKNLSMVVFADRGVPFYIRRFRSNNPAGIVAEVLKTVNFVKNSYSTVQASYYLAADPVDVDYNFIRDELAKQDLHALEMKSKDQLLFAR
jgi:hypothetical protein